MIKNKNIKRKRTTVYLELELYKKLKMLAIEIDKTVGDCINGSIKNYLKKHKK